MPVPYLGSKRKSARKIYQTIKNFNPNGKILADLFCGGLAISEKFLQNGWSVIANDANKYTIALLKEAIGGRFNDKTFIPEFITRQKFENVARNPNNYKNWYVGYVQNIWSFGNNQKDYLFGKDVEPIKHAGHNLVVHKDPSGLEGLIPKRYIAGILRQPDWHRRRLALRRARQRLQQLERLQQLQQLQQLERLQQLQQLERLELQSKDYREVEIPKNAVIYCDPPYEGRTEYAKDGFNHQEFWKWAREKSKTNNVYISEYRAPEDFKAILSFPQKSTLQGGNQKHNNQPDECLFVLRSKLKTP